MESRAVYGYYGETGGVSGESKPRTHASGWRFAEYFFEISGTYEQTQGINHIRVKACDYDHALQQVRKWAKRDGFTVVGDKQGYEAQRTM